ncbi:MAG: transglutaminase domain-containing protein [Candidatus Brocadia sp.]|jgi:transglutaminase-like putative cysteine protease
MKYRIACAVAYLIIVCAFFLGETEASDAPKIRTFEFTYIATVDDIPEGIKQISIWLPYPKNDANQKITPLRISAPCPTSIYKDDKYGNFIFYFSVSNPKSRAIKVEMKFRVKRREYIRRDFDQVHIRLRNDSGPMLQQWLQPDRLVPIDDRIKKLAVEVIRGKTTDLEKARAIYDYTIANLTYDKSGTGWGRGDICYACDVRRGNCTDFHAVFIGFCRAVGIPAKFAIGFSLPSERGQGEIAGYHCWAEFYLKGYGWVPVDASEAYKDPAKKEYFFGAHDENRIQFTIGRDIVLNPPQNGKPLNYFIYPYVEVDEKPFLRVQYKFLFRDLSMENTNW